VRLLEPALSTKRPGGTRTMSKLTPFTVVRVVLSGPKQGSDFEQAAALKTKLGEHVPPYMIPRKFIFLESFPMNANGKADRKKLAETLA
jgi:acyl-coenzyme A synthetase/AMP-(fatty) acid ligase